MPALLSAATLRRAPDRPVDAGRSRLRRGALLFGLIGLSVAAAFADAASNATPLSPGALTATTDGRFVFAAFATAHALATLDPDGRELHRLSLPGPPSGLALSPDGTRLAVTCTGAESTVCLVDVSSHRITARITAGHTAVAPVYSADGRRLFICERHHDDVAVIDVRRERVVARIAVDREPIAAALTTDGRKLLVAHHLPAGAATAPHVAAAVSVIDTGSQRVESVLPLPNGANLLLGIAVSPDGRYAAVTHTLARFYVPTTQVERGWMNTSALTLIDAAALRVLNTVLLDNVERGAANPWAVAWTGDGRSLLVTHAGTHELSVIDFPGLLAKLQRLPESPAAGRPTDFSAASQSQADVPTDLAFLVGLRRRIPLLGVGPRALAVVGPRAWIAGYFSDSLDLLELEAPGAPVRQRLLGPAVTPSAARRGEMLFNDATLCFQHWQSCASCHSYDARSDGLNWDLLNDGMGSPKNSKSLVWAHRTPPAMSLGVRASAEVAVRAGIRHSLFAVLPEAEPAAIDAYLRSLEPQPSPRLDHGRLSAPARRGKRLFEDPRVGCALCHPAPLFTDLKSYDVGTAGVRDGPGTRFDTPSLVEAWRTAPYLHDGSARTISEIFTGPGRTDQHGHTSHLTPAQREDLAAYVLSL